MANEKKWTILNNTFYLVIICIVKPKNKAKREKTDNSDLGDGWARSKFMVQDLEGHNDIICAVSCSGTRLLTGR